MLESMDNFINSFLSTSSWSDMNASSDGSWVGNIAPQTESLLADSLESYGENEKNPAISMVSSGHIMGNLSAEDLNIAHDNSSTIFTDSFKYDVTKGLFLGGNLSQDEQRNHQRRSSYGVEDHEGNFFVPSSIASNSIAASYRLESIRGNGADLPTFAQPLGESNSISSVPTFWPPSYSAISSFAGQDEGESFSFQGKANGSDLPRKNQIGLSSNLVTFESANKPKMICETPQPHHQMAPPNAAGCIGTAKPRTRARRGHATDPHSIAERLRREKIADRMKNLQELVPKSNKTDKASMLDEIIDYVKFLQLQVKVISMSRLGATGAVVPLITDVQAKGTGSLHLLPKNQMDDISGYQDNTAFEQEVVKLMESNVTAAMQYLQSKGLCLMPIALASAISNQKRSPVVAPPDQRKLEDNELNLPGNDANSYNGVVVKQEEVKVHGQRKGA